MSIKRYKFILYYYIFTIVCKESNLILLSKDYI